MPLATVLVWMGSWGATELEGARDSELDAAAELEGVTELDGATELEGRAELDGVIEMDEAPDATDKMLEDETGVLLGIALDKEVALAIVLELRWPAQRFRNARGECGTAPTAAMIAETIKIAAALIFAD